MIRVLLLLFLLLPNLACADKRDDFLYFYGNQETTAIDFNSYGAVLWLRGTDGTWQDVEKTTAADDGDSVEAWVDMVASHSFELDASTAIDRIAGGTRGLTQSYVKAVNQKLVLSTGSSSTLNYDSDDPRTIFFRCSYSTAGDNFVIDKRTGGGLVGWHFGILADTKVYFEMANTSSKRLRITSGTYSSSTSIEAWVVYNGDSDATNTSMRINRSDITETIVNDTLDTTTTGSAVLTVLGRNDGNASVNVQCEEIAVFSSALSSADIAVLEAGYLTTRYGE